MTLNSRYGEFVWLQALKAENTYMSVNVIHKFIICTGQMLASI